MKQPDKTRFLNALADAAYQVSVEKLSLTGDFDAPIYPESLVQIVVAQNLNKSLRCDRIELEFPTEQLERELASNVKLVTDRSGRIDMVCWHGGIPYAIIEVKDQIVGANDGLILNIAVKLICHYSG